MYTTQDIIDSSNAIADAYVKFCTYMMDIKWSENIEEEQATLLKAKQELNKMWRSMNGLKYKISRYDFIKEIDIHWNRKYFQVHIDKNLEIYRASAIDLQEAEGNLINKIIEQSAKLGNNCA